MRVRCKVSIRQWQDGIAWIFCRPTFSDSSVGPWLLACRLPSFSLLMLEIQEKQLSRGQSLIRCFKSILFEEEATAIQNITFEIFLWNDDQNQRTVIVKWLRHQNIQCEKKFSC
ncbi:hypothetical protein HNY73_010061 [Argiope bruennichi]|uniref:Uncharacterized protein n=1 Tax=Argiope bruennichi TaxID=94029 RepID=A0A8T0EZS3_ARGBR|nr:hypothetical protein HNY73_010061 [Argiope bruennichi]